MSKYKRNRSFNRSFGRPPRRVKRRMGKAAGYYSTTFNVWKPTNARRRGLARGGYERVVSVSE